MKVTIKKDLQGHTLSLVGVTIYFYDDNKLVKTDKFLSRESAINEYKRLTNLVKKPKEQKVKHYPAYTYCSRLIING